MKCSLFSLYFLFFFLWKFLFIHDIFNDIFVNLFLSLSELFLYLSLVIISSANNRFRIIGFDENWLFQFSLQLANYFSLHQPTRFGRFWSNTDWFLWFLIDFFYIFSIISEIDSQSIKKIVFFSIILANDWRFLANHFERWLALFFSGPILCFNHFFGCSCKRPRTFCNNYGIISENSNIEFDWHLWILRVDKKEFYEWKIMRWSGLFREQPFQIFCSVRGFQHWPKVTPMLETECVGDKFDMMVADLKYRGWLKIRTAKHVLRFLVKVRFFWTGPVFWKGTSRLHNNSVTNILIYEIIYNFILINKRYTKWF